MSDRTKDRLFHAILPIGGTGFSVLLMFFAIAIFEPVAAMTA